MSSSTDIAGVFIIESLEFEDEDHNRFEGKIISSILALNNVKSKYVYIRTKKEFLKVLLFFKKSNFRYLHISCHGRANSLHTTLDSLPFDELGKFLKPVLKDKRLFLSACSAVNESLALSIIPPSQCYSIIGPTKDIEFRDAAIFWASFYHLMFKNNGSAMYRNDIIENIQKVVNAFNQEFNYYSRSKSKGIKNLLLKVQSTESPIKESLLLE
jgi:hypothetical protein